MSAGLRGCVSAMALIVLAVSNETGGTQAAPKADDGGGSPEVRRVAAGPSGVDVAGASFRVRGHLGHAVGDDLMRASGGTFTAIAGFWPRGSIDPVVFRDGFEGAP